VSGPQEPVKADRDETWADGVLALAPYLPGGLRRWAARRAAARGLGPSALRAAADDAVVLARLGLHELASRTVGGGPEAQAARIAAAAALGHLVRARTLHRHAGPLSPRQLGLIAAAAAPFDPGWASSLLPMGDHESRAACALAAGDFELAQALVERADPTQQVRYMMAAIHAWRGSWRSAREGLNRAFAADGLDPPLDGDSEEPMTLRAFGYSQPQQIIDGPLISVVMPARDAESTLAVSAASIQRQSWRNLELIIVDDASRDSTARIAHSVAEADDRVRVLRNQRGPGAYGARNTGLEAARGVFVAFQDADDWAHPRRLEKQRRVLGDDRGLTLCRHMRIDVEGRPVSPRVFPFIRLALVSAMARTVALRALGPFDEVPVGADSEWLARFDARFGRRSAPRTPEVGMVAQWRSTSLTGSLETGLTGEGLRRRVAYVEQWRRRHAEPPR
jgi:hypothetical protein